MLAKCLKQLRREQALTQAALAAEVAVTQQAVAKWESGRSFPDAATLRQIAEYFHVSTDYLLGVSSQIMEMPPFVDSVMIPIIGAVKAGYDALAYEEPLGEELANVRDPEHYRYLLVRGDSMAPYIRDGDLALVRLQPTLENGDLGVVIYGDGNGTLKKYRQEGDRVILQPFNPDYETIVLAQTELDQLFIFGKVVETKSRW